MDSLGLLLVVVVVTAANRDDGTHAPEVLAKLRAAHLSRLDDIRGDAKYNNRTSGAYLASAGARYEVTVVERPPGVTGLVLLPYRWVVERTNAWTGKYRRNSKDYERTTAAAAAAAMAQVRMTHLMLHRLARLAGTRRQPLCMSENRWEKQPNFPDRLLLLSVRQDGYSPHIRPV